MRFGDKNKGEEMRNGYAERDIKKGEEINHDYRNMDHYITW